MERSSVSWPWPTSRPCGKGPIRIPWVEAPAIGAAVANADKWGRIAGRRLCWPDQNTRCTKRRADEVIDHGGRDDVSVVDRAVPFRLDTLFVEGGVDQVGGRRLKSIVVLQAGVELLLVGDGVIHAEGVQVLFVGVRSAFGPRLAAWRRLGRRCPPPGAGVPAKPVRRIPGCRCHPARRPGAVGDGYRARDTRRAVLDLKARSGKAAASARRHRIQ